MKALTRGIALAIGMAALLMPSVAAAALPQGAPRDVAYGFNDNAVRFGQLTAARDAELSARAGAEVSRVTLDWRFAERTPGQYDFSQYDPIYAALRAQGIRPLWTVMFAPTWAWDPGTAWCASGDCRHPPAENKLTQWGDFLAAIAKRYPESAGIELWNEPNTLAFWHSGPDPARYTRLLKAGYKAIKRADRHMPVVMGGLANRQHTDAGGIAMAPFLRSMYAAGLRGNTDALAFHPYPASREWPVFEASVQQLLDERARGRDGSRPIWATEIGATTAGWDASMYWSADEQAAVLEYLYETLRRVPGVEMVLVHTLLDPPFPSWSPESGYGLIATGGAPRPAWCVMARAVTGAAECPSAD